MAMLSRRQTLATLPNGHLVAQDFAERPYENIKPSRVSMIVPSQSAALRRGSGGKKPSLGSSTAASRRSSLFGKTNNPHSKAMDPRPIGDKEFKAASIRELIAFLTAHSFPAELSPRTLSSPTASLFVEIVQFLLSRIDPHLELEDWRIEIPEIFAQLGYPFKIKAQFLQNVGAPFAWPSLLAALVWLAQLAAYREIIEAQAAAPASADEDDFMGSGGDGESERVFFEYLESAYQRYMNGEDMAQIEAALTRMCAEREDQVHDEISRMSRACEHLQTQIASHEAFRADLSALQDRRVQFASDADKLDSAIRKLEAGLGDLGQQTDLAQRQWAAVQAEAEAVAAQRTQLEAALSVQRLSADDVLRITREHELLSGSLTELARAEEELRRQLWETEVETRARATRCEALAREFNALGATVQVVPSSAKYSFGAELTLEVGAEGVSRDLKGEVKPALQRVLAHFEECSRQLQAERREVRDKGERVRAAAAERRGEVAVLREKIDKYDRATSEEFQRRNQALQEEIQRVQDIEIEILRQEGVCGVGLRQAEAEIQRLDAELEQLYLGYGAEEEALSEEIVFAAERVLQHKANVMHKLASFGHMIQELERFAQEADEDDQH